MAKIDVKFMKMTQEDAAKLGNTYKKKKKTEEKPQKKAVKKTK